MKLKTNLISIINISIISGLIFFNSACTCKKEKTESSSKSESSVNNGEKYASELKEMVYNGYGFKQIRPIKRIREEWKEKHLAKLKELINGLKDNEVIELRGHADTQESPANERTISNYGVAHLRSDFLYKLLTANGVPGNKLIITSVGEKEAIDGIPSSNSENRRVTLHVKVKD